MSMNKVKNIELQSYVFDETVVDQIANHYFVQNTWPLVYFIDSKKKRIAYVGESTNAHSRIKNHLANPLRRKLDRLTLIASNRFNKSATLDIESKLIQYVVADGTYELQNGNGGLRGHNYYEQSEYQRLFEELWEELREMGLVRQSVHDIENSNLFKYSPYKSLTSDQRSAVFAIIRQAVDKDNTIVFVEGSAGTGKTIVATYLMMLLTSPLITRSENAEVETYTDEEYQLLQDFHTNYPRAKIGLIVPMTSLRNTLKKVFKSIPGLQPKMVIGPSDVVKEKYDLVLVDESHRLARRKNIPNYKSFDDANKLLGFGHEGTQLDWILKQSRTKVFFYDAQQSVKPSDIPEERFEKLKTNENTVKLRSQMRVTAGVSFINFVDDLLHCRPTSDYEIPEGYDLRFFDSFVDFHHELDAREREYGLCRKIAGYAWKWLSKKDKNAIDIEIEGMKFQWNMVASEWINSPFAYKEVGCIHTTQGYDLNYAGIIFGHEITYNKELDRIEIIKDNYYDTNGKKGVKDPEKLKEYLINIYKTVMYRGIKGCYVYVCDPALRNYMRQRFKELGEDYVVGTQIKELPFTRLSHDERPSRPDAIPLFHHYAAAGQFSEARVMDECDWIVLNTSTPLDDRYFAMQVVGESMNKHIPNGAYCLFRRYSGGTREGKIVLASHSELNLPDEPIGFTVKRYRAEKREIQGRLFNATLRLVSESTDPQFEPIVLDESMDNVQILAEFVQVLS